MKKFTPDQKTLRLVRSVIAISAVLPLTSGIAQAQIPGAIARFSNDPGYCSSAGGTSLGLDCVASNITQSGTNIGIGTAAPGAKLDVVITAPEEANLTAVRGVQTANSFPTGIGVFGYSLNGTGVLGRTDTWYAAGVEAQSYLADKNNFAFLVRGRSGTTGLLQVDTATPDTDVRYSLQISNNSRNGKGISFGWDTFSSRRWKTNIQTIQGGLAKVERLRGVSFDWKENGLHDIGLVAEEVGEVVPEVVRYDENGKDATSIDYARLTAVLIEAVKEQQSQVRTLQAEMEELQTARGDAARR
jgi:hypothetical protein